MFKLPVSVLVVIHTPEFHVLLLERADHPGYWQSVTGSLDADELPAQAAQREVLEETGIDAGRHVLTDWGVQYEFKIFEEWRHRLRSGPHRHHDGRRRIDPRRSCFPKPCEQCLLTEAPSAVDEKQLRELHIRLWQAGAAKAEGM